MTKVWGLHNDTLTAPTLVAEGFVSIGWDAIGDLRHVGDDQVAMRTVVERAYPNKKPGSHPVGAGVLRRFAFTAQVGDYVIAPDRQARTLNFGHLTTDYAHHPDAPTHRHRRGVEWLQVGVLRAVFSQQALYEVGAMVTMFSVSKHADEFLSFLQSGTPVGQVDEMVAESADSYTDAVAVAEEEPSAAKLEVYTQDFVLKALMRELTHEEFEHFTADLFRAMGYRARVTKYTGDGGVDVLVHKDAFGLEPGLIKVQCKHTTSSHGNADVNQLAGTLGSGEVGLFVSLGSFSTSALAIERQRSDLRLVGGQEVVQLTLENYERLPSTWRSRIPLRTVYVVDRDSEGY